MKEGKQYEISSGKKNAQYTLRVRYSTCPQYSHYIKNLGTSYEHAKEEVREICAKEEGAYFEEEKIGYALNNYEHFEKEEIRFGKYEGLSIEKVFEIDQKYLIWAKQNILEKFNDYQKEFLKNNVVIPDPKKEPKKEIKVYTAKANEFSTGEKREFEGTVVFRKWDNTSLYETCKTIIDCERFAVYFQTTAKAFDDVRTGDKIVFKATVSGTSIENARGLMVFTKRPKLIEIKEEKENGESV